MSEERRRLKIALEWAQNDRILLYAALMCIADISPLDPRGLVLAKQLAYEALEQLRDACAKRDI